MEGVNGSISTCRHCHFYHLEGRRGGYCQQLGVSVQGSWQSCSLGVSPFAKWKQIIGIPTWAAEPSGLNEDAPEPAHTCADVLEVLTEADLGQTLSRAAYPMEATAALESAFESA